MSAIILASRSPRRRVLLDMLEIEHEVDPSGIPEHRQPEETPQAFARRMARSKAMDRVASHPDRWILGADTVVVIGEEILGKPDSAREAERMLLRLSGRRHHVVTALALVRNATVLEGVDETAVWFKTLDEASIQAYVSTGEPLDKAGAYGIQGKGAVLVDRIEGDYFGVMGLSLRVLTDLMHRAGIAYRFTR